MLRFAQGCIGKPFSQTAMARSIVYPRTTTNESFFCAELVAAVLKAGGLIDQASNPGAATPESLHSLFKNRASTTANPYVLRQTNLTSALTTDSIVQKRVYTPPRLTAAPQRNNNNNNPNNPLGMGVANFSLLREDRPRSALRVVSGTDRLPATAPPTGVVFTLESLKMGK